MTASVVLSVAEVPESSYTLVATQDRSRILRNGDRWLTATPETITSFPSPKSPGGLHDYFSEADYFWPNPANAHPDAPWKEIDGVTNPQNFLGHRNAIIRLSQAMPALTAAYVLTHKPVYAHAAAAHLLAWFVTPETRMVPNLQFAQGFHNGPTGRSYGIIDTLHLVEVARAAPFLHNFLSPPQYVAIQHWFRDYLTWMQTSAPGQKERDATNNHGIAWALQAAEFARLTGDEATRVAVRSRLFDVQLPMQMAANGSFPRETARTKPYGYSIFTFDCLTALCQSLASTSNLSGVSGPHSRDGAHTGPTADPFNQTTSGGRSVCLAATFLYPYLVDKSAWPFPHDVQHWEAWPVRSPGLLFCGLACRKPDYIALWRKLDPDPTDPEIIRNFPIRQPLLWV